MTGQRPGRPAAEDTASARWAALPAAVQQSATPCTGHPEYEPPEET